MNCGRTQLIMPGVLQPMLNDFAGCLRESRIVATDRLACAIPSPASSGIRIFQVL